jgi:hypothetical protein
MGSKYYRTLSTIPFENIKPSTFAFGGAAFGLQASLTTLSKLDMAGGRERGTVKDQNSWDA